MKNVIKKITTGILFSSLLAISATFFAKPTSVAEAGDYENGISLVSMIKSVHDNNLQTVTSNPSFDVSLKHGWLNAGPNPGCSDYTVKDSGDFYIGPDNEGNAFIEWGGNRLSRGSDCTIVKITAKKDISIKGYATSVSGGDWTNGNNVQTYVVKPVGNYDYDEKSYIGDGNKFYLIDTSSTELSDYCYELNLKAGQKFYWEFGNWQNHSGNLDISERGFGFKIQEVELYRYPNMVAPVAASREDPIEGSLVDYSIGHGSYFGDGIEENVIPFATSSTNQLGDPSAACNSSNWKITTGFNDGIVVIFIVKEYVKVHVSRPYAGVGWTNGCNVVFAVNGEILKDTVISEDNGDPNGTYYDFERTLKVGEAFMFQLVFRWEDSRSLQMDSTYPEDSMPIFTFESIPHTHNFSTKVNASAATCLNPGHLEYYLCECGVASVDCSGTNIIGGPMQLDEWLDEGGEGYLPITDHSYGEVLYKWNEKECTAYHVCSVCKKEEIIEVATGREVVDTLATCSSNATGHLLAEFIDVSLSEQETEKDSYVFENTMLEHDYEGQQISYRWADDYSSCTASVSCKREGCTNTKTEVSHNIEFIVDTSATCEKDAKGHYKATFSDLMFSFVETEINSATKQGSALGHNYEGQIPEYIWSQDNKKCTASISCSRNGCTHSEVETVDVVESDGQYVANFTNPLFSKQTKDMPKKSGCGGSVVASSVILSTLSLLGAGLVISKKRKENN